MLTTFLATGYVDVATEYVRRQGGHENMFPILSKMARDVHSIPVSTVSSESAFSSSGRIIDDRRHSLKPEMVEALTIYKDWCQHEHRSQETFIAVDEFDNFGVNLENMRI